MHAYETKKVEQRELKALGSQGLYSIVWFFPHWGKRQGPIGRPQSREYGWMNFFTSDCVCRWGWSGMTKLMAFLSLNLDLLCAPYCVCVFFFLLDYAWNPTFPKFMHGAIRSSHWTFTNMVINLKCVGRSLTNMLIILGTIVNMIGGLIGPLNEHENFHFDSEWDMHINSNKLWL